MVPHLMVLGGPDDVFLSPVAFEPPAALRGCLPAVRAQSQLFELGSSGPLVPWGASASAATLAHKLGVDLAWAACAEASRLNSKVFSSGLASRLGVDPGQCCVAATVEEVETAAACFAPGQSFVIKERLGFGGQGRLLARGPSLTANETRWLRRPLARGPLVIEPWLERIEEFSTQMFIDELGGVRLVGHVKGLDTPGGRYGGSRVGCVSSDMSKELYATAHPVALELAQLGARGPVGIDAFTYKTDAGAALRPLVEINVRYTFGAIALMWAERLGHARGTWRFVDAAKVEAHRAAGATLTSPTQVGGVAAPRVAMFMPE